MIASILTSPSIQETHMSRLTFMHFRLFIISERKTVLNLYRCNNCKHSKLTAHRVIAAILVFRAFGGYTIRVILRAKPILSAHFTPQGNTYIAQITFIVIFTF